jgi:hypothetical protein
VPGVGGLPRSVQFQLAVIGPLLLGLVCGFFLGVSAVSFWVVNALGIGGGILGGLEQAAGGGAAPRHDPRTEAAVRGALAGALFGLGLYVAHVVSDDPAHAPLPSPEALIILVSAVFGCLLALAGAALARSRT